MPSTKETSTKTIKVRATRPGYYDHVRRYEGDVFTIPAEPLRPLNARELKLDVFDDVKTEGKGEDGKQATLVPVAFGSWMEVVAESTPERVTSGPEALAKKQEEIKQGKQQSTGSAQVI